MSAPTPLRMGGVRVGPTLLPPAEIFSPSVINARVAMAKRHARPRATPDPVAMAEARKLGEALKQRLPGGKTPGKPLVEPTESLEEFLARYPGAKAEAYRRMHEKQCSDRWGGSLPNASKVQLMVKKEYTMSKGDPAHKVRGIQSPVVRNVAVGRQFYHAQVALKQNVMNGEMFDVELFGRKVSVSIKYGSDLTPEQKAAKIIELAGQGQLYCTDCAAFDGTFHGEAAEIVRDIFAPVLNKEARKHHKQCATTSGTCQAKSPFRPGRIMAFKFKLTDTQRRSGDWDTSSGNSLWNAILQVITFAQLGATTIRVLVIGDDCVVSVRWPDGRPEGRVPDAELKAAGLRLGMELEPVVISDGDTPAWLRADYCSAFVWYGNLGVPTCIGKLYRTLSKWSWCDPRKNPEQVQRERVAAALDALRMGANHVPVLRAFYRTFVRREDWPVDEPNVYAANMELFKARYGLSEEQVEKEETRLLTHRMCTLSQPVVDALAFAEIGQVVPPRSAPGLEQAISEWSWLGSAAHCRTVEEFAQVALRHRAEIPAMALHTIVWQAVRAVNAQARFDVKVTSSSLKAIIRDGFPKFAESWGGRR